MKRKRRAIDRLLSVHVRDYYRWNRAKTLFGVLCMIGAIMAIGGLEGESAISNPKLAGVLIMVGGIVALTIDTDWERKR